MTAKQLNGLIRALRSTFFRLAQVAQLVEQGIENPRVGGSIPSLGTIPISYECTCERRGLTLLVLTLLELTKAAPSPTLDGKALNGAVVQNATNLLLRVSNRRHHLGALTPTVWWLASSPC